MTKNIAEIIELTEQYEKELPPVPIINTNIPLPRMIDHTLLKADAVPDQIIKLCLEAREYHFASVCINPLFVNQAHTLLEDSDVKVCTVVGFPLGAVTTGIKVAETQTAIADGASEIDMVIPVGLIKSGHYASVMSDVQRVVETSHQHAAIVKVILEMAFLTRYEKIIACLICKFAGADFVKTSTGFGPGGATVEDVSLMRRVVGPDTLMGVKAAGGIRSWKDASAMIAAGANRLGASAGASILHEYLQEKEIEGE